MTWALAEGKMDMERETLRNAVSVRLTQDARANRLLLHLAASIDKTFEHIKCHVGYASLCGTDAFDIAKTTESILDRFCTPRADMPEYGTHHRSQKNRPVACIDRDLKARISKAVEMLCTDAAGDELRTGRLMSGRSGSALVSPLFENLILHLKDPSHATGRFLQVWMSDPFLGAVFDLFIGCRGSITNLIQHSPDLQRIFNEHCRNMTGPMKAKFIRNLQYAKQRFNSSQTPLSRFVLFFEAIWATAVTISTVRRGTKSRDGRSPEDDANFFLEQCFEERYLQAAMMADAAEENLMVVRFFDNPRGAQKTMKTCLM